MNKVILTGNIGQDPESRYTPTGKLVVSFSVAVDGGKSDDGRRTDWFNIETWDGTATFVQQYLRKGARVLVEGRLKIDKFEDNGVTKYFTKVVAHNVEVQKWPADGQPSPEIEAELDKAPF